MYGTTGGTYSTRIIRPVMKMEGEIDTEQFMEEIRKHDSLFNRSRKEFKEKFKKINTWSKEVEC